MTLLLRAWVVGVAILFSTVDSMKLQENITHSADYRVAVIFLSEEAR